jgi:hypothetical protein
MIDLAVFHRNLLGLDPKRTPVEFRLTKTHERLYAASRESARHGFLLPSNRNLESWEHFLGTFVLAYGQTPIGSVTFAVSAPVRRWANEQLKKVAHHIFSSRAKASRASIDDLFSKFQRLEIGSSVLQMAEPERWVAYGFTDEDILTPWMRNRLLIAA